MHNDPQKDALPFTKKQAIRSRRFQTEHHFLRDYQEEVWKA
jgi:hypothetical protein